MTRKLPVAETAVGAVQFALRNVWGTLRLGWFSLILVIAIATAGFAVTLSAMPGVLEGYVEAIEEITSQAERAAASGSVWSLELDDTEAQALIDENMDDIDPVRLVLGCLLSMLAGIAFVPMMTLLFRVGAGDIQMPGGFFYWQWGARETRTMLTYLLYVVSLVAIILVIGAVAGVLITVLSETRDLTLSWLPMILPFVLIVLYFWILLRTVLIIPAAAIENETNIFAAVKATGGNVFRMIGSLIVVYVLGLLCMIAFAIVFFVISLLLGGLSMNVGDETTAGMIISIAGIVIMIGMMVYFYMAIQLISFGWLGGAWAALRPDGVKACSTHGPAEGGVCEV